MNDERRHLESKGVRLVVAMLLGVGVIVGSIVLLYFPWDVVLWIPVIGLVIAVGIAIFLWRPLGYVAVGWSGLLVVACAAGVAEFARADAPVGVLLALLVAGFCLGVAGLLEVGLLRRRPRVTFGVAD
jgi:hypothetical protein